MKSKPALHRASPRIPMALYCFSPSVMAATLIVEFVMVAHTLVVYRMQRHVRVAVSLLCCLAIFQMAEYRICTAASNQVWTWVGYVSITLLPPLGIHLVTLVSKNFWLRIGSYLAAAVMVAFFIGDPVAVRGAVCTGNYVILDATAPVDAYFRWYYTVFLAVGIAEALRCFWKMRRVTPETSSHRRLLFWLVISYLSFLLPTAIAYLLDHSVVMALPSVMCGFAIIMAFIVSIIVIPQYEMLRDREKELTT